MTLKTIFERLWHQYKTDNPSVEKLYNLISHKDGTEVQNDHIAFRTFNHPLISIDALEPLFLRHGYEEKGQYIFTEKKLKAKHYEKEGQPRIFISELCLTQCFAK